MKILRRYLPVILWAAVIFLFSSWETPPSPQDTLLNFLLKKTAHLVEYAILYYLAYSAMNPEGSHPSKRKDAILPLVFTIFYAVSDEIHQSFVPGRHGRPADVLIDAAGAAIALLKIKVFNSRQ